MTPIEVARSVVEREREKVKFRVGDPPCWHASVLKDRSQGPSIIEEMGKDGLQFLKADNDRRLGKIQVHNRLKLEEDVDSDTGEVIREYPRTVIFNNHDHFWRTMTELRLDVKQNEDVDTDQEDHIYDEFRYACMTRPVIPKRTHVVPPGSFMAERSRYIKAKKYAQRHGVSLEVAYGRVR